MTPQSASISPRMPRTFHKSPDLAPRFAAFAACMRGWMSRGRRSDSYTRAIGLSWYWRRHESWSDDQWRRECNPAVKKMLGVAGGEDYSHAVLRLLVARLAITLGAATARTRIAQAHCAAP